MIRRLQRPPLRVTTAASTQPALLRLRLLAQVTMLVSLVMLPVQLRAGAPQSHPHALIQVVLDARDGSINHHSDAGDAGAAHAEMKQPVPRTSPARPSPDLPTFEKASISSSSIPLLLMLPFLLYLPHVRTLPSWAHMVPWPGRDLLPELRPPRRALP